jgi:hypothetical protein
VARLAIGIPIGIAAAFEWLSPYFSRPVYIAIGIALVLVVIFAAAMAQTAWRRRKRRAG